MCTKRQLGLPFLLALVSTNARAAEVEVWLEGDGLRIGKSARSSPDPLSTYRQPPPLFALRGETVALQVAIRAGDYPLEKVTVEVEPPSSAEEPRLGASWVDRFVVHSIPSTSRTRHGWSNDEETLGWASLEATPTNILSPIPDALIPVEHAPPWSSYPLAIAANTTSAIWLDIRIPESAPGGKYAATIQVRDGHELVRDLPLVLEVKASQLPFRAARTAVFYDVLGLRERMGTGYAELDLWQLLHRHHLTPMLSADDPEELVRIRPAIDGSAFRAATGYVGPGEGVGDEVIALGAYGSLGEPSERSLLHVHRLAHSLVAIPGAQIVFLYAIDERCDSDRASRWRRTLRASGDPLLIALRVGETCHLFPASRQADLVMVPSSTFRRDEADEARSAGKWFWVYNGQRPRSGALMLDTSPLDLRANGWIAAAFDVDRWFYWEAAFWNDANSGGHGPTDPFSTAETFHNSGGDMALGDGLLVYPGRQLAFPAHSIGKDEVFPSIRLKNLRRGIQDAGYVALVAAHDPELAERIVRSVVPSALEELRTDGREPGWLQDERAFLEARRALWEAIPTNVVLDETTLARALSDVAELRRRRVDRSAEDSSSPFGIGVIAFTVIGLICRRAALHSTWAAKGYEGSGG